jgi:peroxiredoxin-like protein
MVDSYFFQVQGSCKGSRTGKIKIVDVSPGEIRFSAPFEFGGEPGFWTPEHFLLSSVSSCFIATFEAIAKASEFHFLRLEVLTEGIVRKLNGRFSFATITVNPTLTIDSDEDHDHATRLLTKAETSCLVANSLSAPVAFAPQIVIRPLVNA